MIDNYFKVDGSYFFFDSKKESSVWRAWADADELAGVAKDDRGGPIHICAWKPIGVPGPWRGCDLVGHEKQAPLEDIVRRHRGSDVSPQAKSTTGARGLGPDPYQFALNSLAATVGQWHSAIAKMEAKMNA